MTFSWLYCQKKILPGFTINDFKFWTKSSDAENVHWSMDGLNIVMQGWQKLFTKKFDDFSMALLQKKKSYLGSQ